MKRIIRSGTRIPIKAHGVAEVVSKYDPDSVDYMHQLYIKLFRELIKHFSDESYTPRISDIKDQWRQDAINGHIMSDEDFDVVYKALLDEINDLIKDEY